MAGKYLETYYLGCYWGPREETVEQCAARILNLLNRLATVHPFFARWFDTIKSRSETPRAFTVSSEAIASELAKTADATNPILKDIGYSFALWTENLDGNESGISGLRIHCGCHAPVLLNTCVINLPIKGKVAPEILRASTLAQLLEVVALTLEPEWGLVSTRDYRKIARRQLKGHAPIVGWLTYLSKQYGAIPALPQPMRLAPIDGQGSLIVVTDERFTANNPEHVRLADKLSLWLEEAGVLQPLA